ncbi:464_t:CDS:2, partial [Funneliformis geosporum]
NEPRVYAMSVAIEATVRLWMKMTLGLSLISRYGHNSSFLEPNCKLKDRSIARLVAQAKDIPYFSIRRRADKLVPKTDEKGKVRDDKNLEDGAPLVPTAGARPTPE